MILKINEAIRRPLRFCHEDLKLFSRLSGDTNPIHEGITGTEDEPLLVQGMLVASCFGKILTNDFPGPGCVNMERSFNFLNPVYTGKNYEMELKLISVDASQNQASLAMRVWSAEDKLCVDGRTVVFNAEIFNENSYPSLPSSMPDEKGRIVKTRPLSSPNGNGWESMFAIFTSRRSIRYFRKDAIPQQTLSNLLYAACGITMRNEETGKVFSTNPTASNHHEILVYVFSENEVARYNPDTHALDIVIDEDKRKSLSNIPFIKKAPLSLCLVADIDKMVHHSDDYRRHLYSTMDTGYVSQNIYLYCAANNLATCACGMINRDEIAKLLGLTNQRVMLVHPIGIRNKK